MSFASRLRQALEYRTMSAAVLAYRLGVDRSTISNYLNGKYKAKIETVRKIANILDISADWLSGLDVPMKIKTPSDEVILTEGEKEWLELYRTMTEEEREIFLRRFGGEK